jgi:Uma2 family endonuclease
MTLIPSATSDVLPLKFPSGLRLTPEQFELVCAENREAVLELAADGRVVAMTPTGSETSGRNSELLFQLQQYAKASGRWKVFESSAGFRLPDGSVLSPDASPAWAGCSCLRNARLRCGRRPVIRSALTIQRCSPRLPTSPA